MRCLTRHSARRLPRLNRRCGDLHGYGRQLSYLNVAAERLTGWPSAEALGQPFEAVLRIMDSATGTTVRNPMKEAALHDTIVGLPSACIWFDVTA